LKKLFLLLLILFVFILSFAGEKVRVIIISMPDVDVYVNGRFVGTVGFSGKLPLSLSIGTTFYVNIDSYDYVQIGDPIIYKEEGVVMVFINAKPAAYLGVISNVYPLDVFTEGNYWGRIDGPKDLVKLPAGKHKVTLKKEGYKLYEATIALSWKEKTYISAELEKLPFQLKIFVDPEVFSPNGDWKDDLTTIGIYTTSSEVAKLFIKSSGGQLIFQKSLITKPGLNEVTWNGGDAPDGTYEVIVECRDKMAKASVRIDRSAYTYKKEITLSLIALFLLGAGWLIWESMAK